MEKSTRFAWCVIEHNLGNLLSGLEIQPEKVEAEIDFVSGVGAITFGVRARNERLFERA